MLLEDPEPVIKTNSCMRQKNKHIFVVMLGYFTLANGDCLLLCNKIQVLSSYWRN